MFKLVRLSTSILFYFLGQNFYLDVVLILKYILNALFNEIASSWQDNLNSDFIILPKNIMVESIHWYLR